MKSFKQITIFIGLIYVCVGAKCDYHNFNFFFKPGTNKGLDNEGKYYSGSQFSMN